MNTNDQRRVLSSVATVVVAVTVLWSVALDSLPAHVAIAICTLFLRERLASMTVARGVPSRLLPRRALAWGLAGLALGLVVTSVAGYGKWWIVPTTLLWGCVVGETCFGMLLHLSTRTTTHRLPRVLALGGAAGFLTAIAMSVPSVLVRDAAWGEIGATSLTLLAILVPFCIVLALFSSHDSMET